MFLIKNELKLYINLVMNVFHLIESLFYSILIKNL